MRIRDRPKQIWVEEVKRDIIVLNLRGGFIVVVLREGFVVVVHLECHNRHAYKIG